MSWRLSRAGARHPRDHARLTRPANSFSRPAEGAPLPSWSRYWSRVFVSAIGQDECFHSPKMFGLHDVRRSFVSVTSPSAASTSIAQINASSHSREGVAWRLSTRQPNGPIAHRALNALGFDFCLTKSGRSNVRRLLRRADV